MQQLFPHEKRQTVPGTLHGTINQVIKAMFHAFIEAYTTDRDFYIVTEDITFGDFDDLVLVTDKGCVTATQYKHVKTVTATTSVSVNDVITKSGNNKELMFYKYYASLQNKRPGWINDPNLFLELTTNSPIDTQLSICIDPNTKSFTPEFFANDMSLASLIRKIIIASILKFNQKLNGAIPHALTPYLDYLEHLLPNYTIGTQDLLNKLFNVFKPTGGKKNYYVQEKFSHLQTVIQELRDGVRVLSEGEWGELKKVLESNLIPHAGISHLDVICAIQHQEYGQVNLFLNRFKLVYSEPNKDSTILAIKQKLLDVFKQGSDAVDILYHSFFYDFLEWLASENVTHITNTDIKRKFSEWQGRLIQFQRWIGVSTVYQKGLVTTIEGEVFERRDIAEKLHNFRKSQKRVLVIFGERGIGKSSSVYQYLKNNQQFDSDFLMLDINTILRSLMEEQGENRCSFNFFHACQMIVFENCEDMNNYPLSISEAFATLITSSSANVKFVLAGRYPPSTSNEKVFGMPSDQVEITEVPKLEKEAVIKVFPFIYELTNLSRHSTFYQKEHPNVLLNNLICQPFYLRLLVAYYNKYKSFTINFSTADDFVKVILEALLTSAQIAVVRRLIYLLSQRKETASLFPTYSVELEALIKQNIVVKKEQSYEFSHKLYEGWAIRISMEGRLMCMIESKDTIEHIYEEMLRILPSHRKEVYVYLGENIPLKEDRCARAMPTFPQYFLSNNNLYLVDNALKNNKISLFITDSTVLYILADTDPVGLLTQLLAMLENTNIVNLLCHNEGIKRDFYTVLIRGFCLAENVTVAGKLLYQILQKLDKHIQTDGYDLDYYMEKFFVNAFAGFRSVGLMSVQAKLRFLKDQCGLINLNSSGEEVCYFQYVYQGLVKAATPDSSGDASYPEHRCFFATEAGNLGGYVNCQGRYFPFSIETLEAQANYHCEAIRILLDFYNQQKGSNLTTSEDALRDLIKCFEMNVESVTYQSETRLIYIINIACIIAAEINLNSELLQQLSNLLENSIKSAENFFKTATTDSPSIHIFDPHQTLEFQKSHISLIEGILQWRKENQFQTYKREELQILLVEASVARRHNASLNN